jgi:hypothetical protein
MALQQPASATRECWNGTWETTLAHKSVAHGRMEVQHEAGTDVATVKVTYDGLYYTNGTWTGSCAWPPREGSASRVTGEIDLCDLQRPSEDCICGTYSLRGNLVDRGSFRLQRELAVAPEKKQAPVERGEDLIPTRRFYNEWSGHTLPHLTRVFDGLRRQGKTSFVYLAGDSSLDNKAWLLWDDKGQACNGYENVLDKPDVVQDICHWINVCLSKQSSQSSVAAINTSIEATTLAMRADGKLLPQDYFLRDHLTAQDTLIVSVGGNDIALAPSLATVAHLISLLALPAFLLSVNPSFHYLVRMFRDSVQAYIENLTSKARPRRVLVCMIYYPCAVLDRTSWAARFLSISGYDRNPKHLQTIIQALFREATQQIRIEGTEVVPVPLYEILDVNNPKHYKKRVEPSVEGGRLMAERFVELLSAGASSHAKGSEHLAQEGLGLRQ